MKSIFSIKSIIIFFILLFAAKVKSYAQGHIQIHFYEYNVIVEDPFKIGDTVLYKLSHNEFFKFVFSDFRGKCYCERFINNKLYEKGYYQNSLDTLKEYAASKYANGKSSKPHVIKYFEPLKTGKWIIYKDGAAKSELYIMGVPDKKLIHD